MYPANVIDVALSIGSVDAEVDREAGAGDSAAVLVAGTSGAGVVCCCGGSRTGTPVRACRNDGMIEMDCEVGVRMRRRRGLAMS